MPAAKPMDVNDVMGTSLTVLRRQLWYWLLLLGASHFVVAQSVDPVAAGVYEKASTVLDALLRDEKLTGAGIGVIWPGMQPWLRTGGLASRERELSFTTDTPIAQQEFAQLHTAIAVLQLIEAGKLELDAPFNRYVPEFQPHSGQWTSDFTIRQLLSHHSGLPAYYAPGSGREAFRAHGDDEAWREVLAHGGEVALIAAPGEVYEYSDLGYVLLGLLIERVSGENYVDYVKRHILEPLSLQHTFFTADPRTVPGIADAHDDGERSEHERLRDLPAAGLVASLNDTTVLLQALLSGGQGVLSSASVALLFSAHERSPYDGNLGVGMGVYVATPWQASRPDLTLISQSAIADGTRTYLAAVPQLQLGVVLTTNDEFSSIKLRDAAESVLQHMVEVSVGRPVPGYARHRSSEWSEERRAALLGTYSGPGGLYRVERTRSNLRLDVPFLPFVRVNLVPRQEDHYAVELRFLGLNLGRLSALQLVASGLESKIETVNGERLWHWYLRGESVVTLTELRPAQESEALAAWRMRLGHYESELTGAAYRLDFDRDSGNLTFGREGRGLRRWGEAPDIQCVVDAKELRSCNRGLTGTGSRKGLRLLEDGRLLDSYGVHYRPR